METRTLTIAPDYGSEYEVRKQREANPEIEVAVVGLSEEEMISVVRAAERQRLLNVIREAVEALERL